MHYKGTNTARITEVKERYFHAIDTKNWDLLWKVFTPDARFRGFGPGIGEGLETLIETLEERFKTVTSKHMGFSLKFAQVSPSTLRAFWHMKDELHWPPGDEVLSSPDIENMCGINGEGWYEDELTETPAGLRITYSRLIRQKVEALTPTHTINLPIGAPRLNSNWLFQEHPSTNNKLLRR